MKPNAHVFHGYFGAAAFGVVLLLSAAHPIGQIRRAAAPPPTLRDPCTSAANEIVAENCKPGNDSTEWDINGNGDPSRVGCAPAWKLRGRPA